MEKRNRQIDPFREIENYPPMSDPKCINKRSINQRSSSKSKKNKKNISKDVKQRIKKETNIATQREDDVPVISSLKQLHKGQKKKKGTRKMGAPIILEDTGGEYPTIPLPSTLSEASTVEHMETAVFKESFCPEKKKKRNKSMKKAQITIVESINPSPESSERNYKKSKFTNLSSKETFDESAGISKNNDNFASQIAGETAQYIDQSEADFSSDFIEDADETIFPNENHAQLEENNDDSEGRQLPRFYSFRNKVLTIIKPDCKFCFHGKLRVRVLYGAVKIYGVSLTSAKTKLPVTIYAPRAYSPVAIEAIESEIQDRDVMNIWHSLEEQCTDRKVAKRLQHDISNVDDGWSIIELKNFDNELTNFLVNYCPFRLFPRIDDPSNHSWREARRAEIVLQANLRSIDPCKQLTIGSRAIDDLADGICYDWETKGNSRTVIAGGKGVGKSTTSRYMVNKLLGKSKAVVFIDLDPGQAEFTPAGCISLNIVEEPLLGPSFTHLKTPYYQLYIGSSDVTRCFTHYFDGIKKLVDRLSEDPKLTHLPILVNTMGFCKGIGWDIINYIVKVVCPTDVVQILSKRSKNNFEDTLSRQVIDRQTLGWMTWTKDTINKPTKHHLHVIYSEAETGNGTAESWNLEPHQQRDLVMLAYLSQIIGNRPSSALLQRPLTPSIHAIPPYTVPFSAMSVSLAGAFIPQVLSVMNGNIVALCGVDMQSSKDSNSDENISTGYPRVLVRPPLSTCYGFGILRGVDMEKEQIFLNTPLSPTEMEHVNCLIGCINVPIGLLQLNQQGAPYTGSEYDLPTSRGPRRGYTRTRFQTDS